MAKTRTDASARKGDKPAGASGSKTGLTERQRGMAEMGAAEVEVSTEKLT